jgi:hypothetical protein
MQLVYRIDAWIQFHKQTIDIEKKSQQETGFLRDILNISDEKFYTILKVRINMSLLYSSVQPLLHIHY